MILRLLVFHHQLPTNFWSQILPHCWQCWCSWRQQSHTRIHQHHHYQTEVSQDCNQSCHHGKPPSYNLHCGLASWAHTEQWQSWLRWHYGSGSKPIYLSQLHCLSSASMSLWHYSSLMLLECCYPTHYRCSCSIHSMWAVGLCGGRKNWGYSSPYYKLLASYEENY